jgi:N-methylhydantoinase B/oxoprolinase/acetone carboxylase alpha subunit
VCDDSLFTTCNTKSNSPFPSRLQITDPEILERRYPTILHQFSLRKGSGGKGQHNGGDGIIRVRLLSFLRLPSTQEIEFTEKTIQVSILSERRTYAPWGLEGGGDAQCGRNRWFKLPRKDDGDLRTASKDEHGQYKHRVINLGGKATVKMGKGDRIMIETPGGGAWGKEGEEKRTEENDGRHERGAPRGSHYERLAAQEGV